MPDLDPEAPELLDDIEIGLIVDTRFDDGPDIPLAGWRPGSGLT